MAYSTRPEEPFSFDPAIHLHSESGDCELSTSNNSDDLEALNEVHEDAIAKKNELGTVIQHRAWKVADVFGSEEDYHLETPCAKGSRRTDCYDLEIKVVDPPSSPPIFKMPLISSPPTYPPSSSPPKHHDQRKRFRPAKPFEPAKKKRLFSQGSTSAKPQVRPILSQASVVRDASTSHHDSFRKPEVGLNGPFVEEDDDEMQEPSLPAMCDNEPSFIELPFPVLPSTRAKSTLLEANVERIRLEPTPCIRTARGIRFSLHRRVTKTPTPYEKMVASRSKTAPGRAKTDFYGIDIQKLIDDTVQESSQVAEAPPKSDPPLQSVETPANITAPKKRTMMWTEKYRARKFTDLIGDERTHRTVLKWLKGWDPIVFPGHNKPKPKSKVPHEDTEERPHRKILLLAGPPGLGKTTLAHVCAKQTGYEVVEINASDERSRDVVKGRIRDSVGTENVRGVNVKTEDGNIRKAGRPVCVVVDEVDGVIGGSSGGGEGGFIKALIDLVLLDQKNSKSAGSGSTTSKKGKKEDQFRLLRPMILICNDVYHPALRPLRASSLAEIIHIRKPLLDKVVARMRTVFEKEGILSDKDGVRRLCEAAWGISNGRESRTNSNNTGEGDIRGVLVVGEWAASKLRGSSTLAPKEKPRLTKQWVEKHMLADLAYEGGGSRGVGRGGAKEAVDRVFLDGAGFPKSVAPLSAQNQSQRDVRVGVAELGKRVAIERLREVIDMSGECERIMTDCFTVYPSHQFQDDTFLSKPNAAYEWLHFHDTLSSKIFDGQEWELNPYLSQSILGFHHLFASPVKNPWSNDRHNQWNGDHEEEPLPFTGPRADFSAYEAEKANRSLLQQLQSSLPAPLLRSFRSPEELATDLIPQLIKMLTPDIKPIVVGGSGDQRGTASVRREGEREMARRAVEAMSAVNVIFERSRIEDARGSFGGFVYRMEPPLDTLSTFETTSSSTTTTTTTSAPTRYAVRQVLDQEYQKYLIRQQADARQARFASGNPNPLHNNNNNNDKYHPLPNHLVDSDPSSFTNKENLLNSSSAQTGLLSKSKSAKAPGVKRDFFGRVITNEANSSGGGGGNGRRKGHGGGKREREGRVWVSYHEGYSNAVRKPIGLEELVRGCS